MLSEEYREGYESFFTNKEVFDDRMRKAIRRYKNIRLSQRKEEDPYYKEKIRRRDLLLDSKFKSQNRVTDKKMLESYPQSRVSF